MIVHNAFVLAAVTSTVVGGGAFVGVQLMGATDDTSCADMHRERHESMHADGHESMARTDHGPMHDGNHTRDMQPADSPCAHDDDHMRPMHDGDAHADGHNAPDAGT